MIKQETKQSLKDGLLVVLVVFFIGIFLNIVAPNFVRGSDPDDCYYLDPSC